MGPGSRFELGRVFELYLHSAFYGGILAVTDAVFYIEHSTLFCIQNSLVVKCKYYAHVYWNDVGWTLDDRKTSVHEATAKVLHIVLMRGSELSPFLPLQHL